MRLAAIGSNCVDCYHTHNSVKGYPGGGPVNMAVYTTRLGGNASYIGPIGNDANGKILIEGLESKGVNISHLEVKEGDTAVTDVELVNGERIFGEYREGVMKDYKLSSSDIDFILSHDVVVADLWGHSERYLQSLQSKGIMTAFDCADRVDDEICKVAIPFTDYLFFSYDGEDNPLLRNKVVKIANQGPKYVIVMLGENGSICFHEGVFYKQGIYKADNLLDTMGAGDSYIAGFLFGQVEYDGDIKKSMDLGAKTATETISYFGAW